jgi:hypothetical protein
MSGKDTPLPLLRSACPGVGADTSRRSAGIFCPAGAEKGSVPLRLLESVVVVIPLMPSSMLPTEGEDLVLPLRLKPTDGAGGEGFSADVAEDEDTAFALACGGSSVVFTGERRFGVPLIGDDTTCRGFGASWFAARVVGGRGQLLVLRLFW